jgi:tetratricopeptide (TPR) repeat protein
MPAVPDPVESQNALRLLHGEIYALTDIARQAAAHSRHEDARMLLQGLIVLEPLNGFLHTCLGYVCMRMGLPSEALGAFERALACDPEDAVARTYTRELAGAREHVEPASTRRVPAPSPLSDVLDGYERRELRHER